MSDDERASMERGASAAYCIGCSACVLAVAVVAAVAICNRLLHWGGLL